VTIIGNLRICFWRVSARLGNFLAFQAAFRYILSMLFSTGKSLLKMHLSREEQRWL